MANIDLKALKNKAKKEIEQAQDLAELNEIYQKYLGKSGEITRILHSLKDLPKTKRAKVGKDANDFKLFFEPQIESKTKILKDKTQKNQDSKDWLDITRPGKKPDIGHLHPLTLELRKAGEIFQSMGFSIIEGPEIETEWYNFDALNFPKNHPARDMQDTCWLKGDNAKDKFLLRTHTSPVQIRYMEKHQPPYRIIVPGRVFRNEATDASHEINFYQIEGLMVGKDISVANFKAIIEEFCRRFFGKAVKIKIRPSFFPFTEPSFEIDLLCINCLGKGCPACSQTGWMEMLGAGMVHPNVLKNAGLNSKDWQGFAFGLGFDRWVMMKYKIDDIRLFYSGDLRFLKQF